MLSALERKGLEGSPPSSSGEAHLKVRRACREIHLVEVGNLARLEPPKQLDSGKNRGSSANTGVGGSCNNALYATRKGAGACSIHGADYDGDIHVLK